MTNKQMNFIVKTNYAISNMSSKCYGGTFSLMNSVVDFEIKDGNVLTSVDGRQYTDTLPLKGSRRDRIALANMVCEHICKTWGGSMEEVAEYNLRFLREFAAVMYEYKERINK